MPYSADAGFIILTGTTLSSGHEEMGTIMALYHESTLRIAFNLFERFCHGPRHLSSCETLITKWL
jgi:hypothetical protein